MKVNPGLSDSVALAGAVLTSNHLESFLMEQFLPEEDSSLAKLLPDRIGGKRTEQIGGKRTSEQKDKKGELPLTHMAPEVDRK